MPSPTRPFRSGAMPLRGDAVRAAATAVYSWRYEPEIDELRTLYANGLDRQWIAMRDLDWERGIDREALKDSRVSKGIDIHAQPQNYVLGTGLAGFRPVRSLYRAGWPLSRVLPARASGSEHPGELTASSDRLARASRPRAFLHQRTVKG